MPDDVGFSINKVSGTDGSVRLPDVGVLVGWFSTWSLSKKNPLDSTYVLKATFGHVNETLWNQDYRKEFTVKLSKDKVYSLAQPDGAKVELNGNQLTMEQVSLTAIDNG